MEKKIGKVTLDFSAYTGKDRYSDGDIELEILAALKEGRAEKMLAEDHPMRLKSVVHPKYELGSIAGRSLVRMMKDPDWKIKDFNYRFPVKMNNGNSVKKL